MQLLISSCCQKGYLSSFHFSGSISARINTDQAMSLLFWVKKKKVAFCCPWEKNKKEEMEPERELFRYLGNHCIVIVSAEKNVKMYFLSQMEEESQ